MMKTYIAPVMKKIVLNTEENMLLSGSGNDSVGITEQASNERDSYGPSSSIWGED